MISVSIVCFNDGKKLERCLMSVLDFANEIVVVDLGSTDESKQIAQKFNVKLYDHKFVPYVELVRNYAVDKTSGDWVLVLDPDEEISSELVNRLKEISQQREVVAVNIPRKNIFFGKWISHTNWWPDRHVRFFKKGKVKWSSEIHIYPKVDGKILELQAKENLAIVHFGYDSISQFIDRQNRYSQIEAQNLYDLGRRFSWSSFFWQPLREFLVRFVRHIGFLDGIYGFALTFLMMIYQLEVIVKVWELEKQE